MTCQRQGAMLSDRNAMHVLCEIYRRAMLVIVSCLPFTCNISVASYKGSKVTNLKLYFGLWTLNPSVVTIFKIFQNKSLNGEPLPLHEGLLKHLCYFLTYINGKALVAVVDCTRIPGEHRIEFFNPTLL